MATDGGFQVTQRMRTLIAKAGTDGFLSTADGGQDLRNLYRQASLGLDPRRLSPFAFACFVGWLSGVEEAFRTGQAPHLDNKETGFEFGYLTLVVGGSQRFQDGNPPAFGRHIETLNLLLSRGCPIESEDICRYTALEHAVQSAKTDIEIIRTLLKAGANPNHKNIYGMTPAAGAIMIGFAEGVDLLMEYGADLTIRDAEGTRFSDIYVNGGPEVTAVVTRWLRAREGKTAPRETRACASCGKSDVKLLQCKSCHSILYCSAACQRSNWKTHKPNCVPFSSDNTVMLKPIYVDNSHMIPIASFARAMQGQPTRQPTDREQRASHYPTSFPKSYTIKIQVPGGSVPGPFLVYDRKRELVCYISRQDAPDAYDRVIRTVRSKGTSGLKGYFAAELKSKDKLVVKVGEILAEQPF